MKQIPDKLFRNLHWRYQPTQLYLRVGFLSPIQAFFSWFVWVIAWVRATTCASCPGLSENCIKKNKTRKTPGDIIILHLCTKNLDDLQFLRYRAWQTETGNLDQFLPFYPPKNLSNQNFEKIRKSPGDILILYMYTINKNHDNFLSFCVIFCTFTQLSTRKTRILKKWKKLSRYIILHFTLVFDKWQSYDVWFLRYAVQQTSFCYFGPFLPFYPNNILENKIFEKIRKSPWDIIISHMCIINDNHVMYGSWDMEHNSFFYHFRPLYPTNNQKNYNFKKMKETPGEHHFKVMYHKWWSYDLQFLRYGVWPTEFLSFWIIFCPFTSKFWNEKTA